MTRESRTDMQTTDQPGLPAVPEQTRPGAVYTPSVDIFENENQITLLADMPGVRAADLKIDLRENVLTLEGRAAGPEGDKETDALREYRSAATFFRQFTLSETIDQAKIDAKLTDGVLRLELPKVERAKPRQITVRAG